MSSGRIRYSSCKIDYNPFFDTGLSRLRIVRVSWLLLIKLFELEMSARKADIQLGLSYPTALKGFESLAARGKEIPVEENQIEATITVVANA